MAVVLKFKEFIIICFVLFQGFVAALNCSSPTPASLTDELEKSLFNKKYLRPVENFSNPLNITVSITVVGILGVNERAQSLTTVLWQVLEWDIYGLSWDEKECGTKRVSVPREKLWVPDIHIGELISEDSEDTPSRTPFVYLYNTAHVFDDKPIKVVTSCQLGIYTFPFDVQNCSLTFGSYLHFASDIRMIQGSTSKEILEESRDVLVTNGEWELADVGTAEFTLALEVGSYSEIKYFLILRRRPIVYVVNLLIPSCFLITLDLFSFLLPPHSVDRSSFKMTLILGYTVFLLIMNDLLPVTGETSPLINVFFSVSLALMVASLLETLVITNIQFSSSQYRMVPHWLNVLVLRYLAVVVCIPPKREKNVVTVTLNQSDKGPPANSSATNMSDRKIPKSEPPEPALEELRSLRRDLAAIRLHIDKDFQRTSTFEEWQMIGRVLDRLLFGLYIVFIFASFLTIIIIWIQSNSYTK
ncbi:5-hydroxytryptamine receptor 3A-like [Pholidichthys leucotaenia]